MCLRLATLFRNLSEWEGRWEEISMMYVLQGIHVGLVPGRRLVIARSAKHYPPSFSMKRAALQLIVQWDVEGGNWQVRWEAIRENKRLFWSFPPRDASDVVWSKVSRASVDGGKWGSGMNYFDFWDTTPYGAEVDMWVGQCWSKTWKNYKKLKRDRCTKKVILGIKIFPVGRHGGFWAIEAGGLKGCVVDWSCKRSSKSLTERTKGAMTN